MWMVLSIMYCELWSGILAVNNFDLHCNEHELSTLEC